METKLGVCKYCGQSIALSVPEDFTAEEIAQEAVRKCNCEQALYELACQSRLTAAEVTVDEAKIDSEPIREIIAFATKAIAYQKIQKVSVASDGYIVTMSRTDKGCKVVCKETTTNAVQS